MLIFLLQQTILMAKYMLKIFSKIGLNKARIKNIYLKMLSFEPKYMLLQPSIAEMLLDVIKSEGLPPINTLKYVEMSGEMLSGYLRKSIEDFFECKVANQYGSYEFNSIAYECPYGNMHIFSQNVYVEIEDKNNMHDNNVVSKNEEGPLIVTSLTNKRNPFVRYRIGDVGRINRELKCKCGNCNEVLELTVGRNYNYILCEDGSEINAYIFVRAVENINLLLDDIVRQFQVIQKDINKFEVRLYLDGGENKESVKQIFEENILEDRLKNASFEYSFEKEYLVEEFGDKLMYFRREDRE